VSVSMQFGAGANIPPGTVIEYAGERQVLVNGLRTKPCPPDPKVAEMTAKILKMQAALERIVKTAESDDMAEKIFHDIALEGLA
jgi:hypothetical protein